MIAALKAGSRFYCHVGVPIDPESEDGFAYPKDGKGRHNTRKMRLCRGYLNMIGRHWDREFAAAGPFLREG